jgi:hypothetical protein
MSDRKNARHAAALASPLTSRQTVDEAISILLAQRQAETVAALRAALDRPMPETIQPLHAALQALSATLALCARLSDAGAFDDLLRDVQALIKALDEACRWDRLVAETLSNHIDALAGVADVAALSDAAAAARLESHRRVRALLDGPLPQRLLLGLAFLVSQPRWRGDDGAISKRLAAKFRVRSKREIARLDKRLQDRGKALRRLPEDTQQALRGDVVHLAAVMDLVAPLWPRPPRFRRYRQHVHALQSALDGLHEARMTQQGLNRIAEQDPSPAVQRAVGAIGGWSVRDRTERLSKLDKLWRDFRAAKRFW